MTPEHISIGDLFAKSCTYTVPLFQRPYVWDEERWRLLWEDVARVADDALWGKGKVRPHFLGSVVLQQRMGGINQGARREVIDGQQRLTTLQLLLKAAADAMLAHEATADAARPLLALVFNAFPPKNDPEAAYKVWPTNVDRLAFRTVMDVKAPSDGGGSGRILEATKYFKDQALIWLAEGGAQPDTRIERADALSLTLRERLWIIALNLGDDDQAQVIFETLNARGTPLLPADLVKNLLLRQAEAEGENAAQLYADHWQSFDEDAFWREKVGRGHAARARVDLFLQHALQIATRSEVATANLYDHFRSHLAEKWPAGSGDKQTAARRPAGEQLAWVSLAATAARPLYVADESDPDRVRQTAARLRAMDFQTAFPLLLDLRTRPGLAADDVAEACVWVESWLVRRMVCELPTRAYSRFFTDKLRDIKGANPVAPALKDALSKPDTDLERWPLNAEFGASWRKLRMYSKLRRDRLTMILRALNGELYDPKRSDPVTVPKTLDVEHVMPRSWQAHWPLPIDADAAAAEDRDALLDTIGNLTLLKSKLNQVLSNAPWTAVTVGGPAKQDALKEHGLLTLNLLLGKHPVWDEKTIRSRTESLLEAAIRIWPGPTEAKLTGGHGTSNS